MKNYEIYEKEILELTNKGKMFALVNDKIVDCDKTICNDCDFAGTCTVNSIKWLYAEHVEKPKINNRTNMFFEAIETGWVARDMDGSIVIYENKPIKVKNYWISGQNGGDNRTLNTPIYRFLTLDFIKWEDDEPWSVEDILKLEVEG